jgi:hypothetical protein
MQIWEENRKRLFRRAYYKTSIIYHSLSETNLYSGQTELQKQTLEIEM